MKASLSGNLATIAPGRALRHRRMIRQSLRAEQIKQLTDRKAIHLAHSDGASGSSSGQQQTAIIRKAP